MKSTNRFVFLDGLRGIAALAVVGLHAIHIGEQDGFLVANVGLAVDFFFGLSGFVVACAYERRLLADMSLPTFMQKRMIRLYPMIVAGVLLGVISALYVGRKATDAVFIDAAAGLLMFPIGVLRSHVLFPANLPMWSLFFEIVACLGYAFAVKWLPARWWLPVVGLTGALLATAAYLVGDVTSIGTFGTPTVIGGLLRVFYPFLVGVLIYRLGWYQRFQGLPTILGGGVLLAILFAPTGGHWLLQVLAVLFLLPGVLLVSANAKVRNVALWDALGRLSYPLYLVHWPVLAATHHAFADRLPPLLSMTLGALISIVIAVAVLLIYDEPTRRWLSGLTVRAASQPDRSSRPA